MAIKPIIFDNADSKNHLDHKLLLKALKDEDGRISHIWIDYGVGEWPDNEEVEMTEAAIRSFIKNKNGKYIEIEVDWKLSGHMYRGAIHETATDCGNCNGARCDDEFDKITGQQYQWACRKKYSYYAKLK
jgi:hypothetical protein